MLRLSVFFLSPLVAVALVYWLGFYALLGCFALALGTFLLSTDGPKVPSAQAGEAACRHGMLRRRSARMARL